ncbi:hypothetical protein KSP35_20175 [Aquihabitans sp. G128]|uniref:SCO6880 family protein n=1 Tax=Aquihabitans sp. G128 TaxID=2849779 RepID=UPI001C216B68|nr:SCO6880 family protein [Aquihabitans sp. G128]QXC60612.1 hypothetical protein KSP35_20175 [Aquihabitans sp. G128]
MAPDRQDRTYRLEPLDPSGIFLGLGAVQCAFLGGGISSAVVALTAGLPLPVAVLPVLLSVAASFARLGGQALWEWIPLGATWTWTRLRRGRSWVAPLPLLPAPEGTNIALPPCLAGLDVTEVPWRARLGAGAVRDTVRNTLTALVHVSGPQFVVESRPEQERLLAGWGDVLNQFATERGIVTHLGWSDLARPSGLHEHLAWLSDQPAAADASDAADSYRELVEVGTSAATAHDVVVTITVARDRLGRRRTSEANPEDLLQRALVSAVDALLRGLRAAGLTASDPLDVAELHRLLRERIEPTNRANQTGSGRLVDRLRLVTRTSAGPLATETTWSALRVDGAWHRTYWVACWPRLAVPPSWMEPFLSGGGITRTTTVILLPVSTWQSRRRIERDLVKHESDAATKEEKGRRVDARHRRATQALLDREEELVAGYAEMAYVGLVTVTASSSDELDEHCEITEQLARESGMELRSLDGRQDLAWAAALPLGLAPRTLVAT